MSLCFCLDSLASSSNCVQPESWWSGHFYSPIRFQARPRNSRDYPMASQQIAGAVMTTSSWNCCTVFRANLAQIHGTAVPIWGTVEAQVYSPSSAWHCPCKGHNFALVVKYAEIRNSDLMQCFNTEDSLRSKTQEPNRPTSNTPQTMPFELAGCQSSKPSYAGAPISPGPGTETSLICGLDMGLT